MSTARAADPALVDALRYEWLCREFEAAAARNRADEARRQYQEAQQDESMARREAMLMRRAQARSVLAGNACGAGIGVSGAGHR